jgi:hypothetical protein
MIFVVAGTYQEYRDWCIKNHYRTGATYVDSPVRLKGYNQPHGKFIGTWYERDDIYVILILLKIAGSIDDELYESLYRLAIGYKIDKVALERNRVGIE